MFVSGTRDLLRGYGRLSLVAVLNAPLVMLILLKNIEWSQFGPVAWAYFISVCLGYYVLAFYVVASLSYFLLFPFRRLALAVGGIIITIIVYFLLVDSFVAEIVRRHIDFFWLEWVINDLDAFGLSAATLRGALVALLFLAALELGIFALSRRLKHHKRVAVAAWVLLLALYVVSQAAHAVAYEKNDIRITSLTPQLPFYLPITSHRNAARYGGALPIGEDEFAVESADATVLNYPRHAMEYEPFADSLRPNIVVFFFESWRFDMLNDSATPHVNALARKSTVCLNHFCSGNSTVAGVFGFFYGLHPTYWPAVKAENLVIHNPVLMDVLSERGYTFGIFAKSNYERHKIKDAVFRDITVREAFAGVSAVQQDADMTAQLIAFFRQQKQTGKPFLAHAFYKSNHAPYRYPASDTVFRPAGDKNLVGIAKDADPTLYLNDYRNATRYVDRLIGEVLHELDTLGFLANTIVIVSTDHGEEFNDNRDGFWGHGSNYTQYQTRVPLVFYAPGKEPRCLERVTGHVDVVPTLLEEFLGCLNPPEDYSNGCNLFTDGEDARPMVIGSYVNHAFVVGDDVFEVNPLYVEDYKLDDIQAKASAPTPEALKRLADELGRFFGSHEERIGQAP